MKDYKIKYLKAAINEITDISHYISVELDSPDAANSVVDLIFSAIYSLSDFPYAFPTISSSLKKRKFAYRKLVVKNYIVIFRVNQRQRTIYIDHVVHARRNYMEFL